ncbi:phosphoenolpyruvate--protein phosphotransferase [Phormidium tenue FACHB-886]|nr:phosphoenolpyruvate--protein phosphotransferase [Phormidium tenue FACHB-886]
MTYIATPAKASLALVAPLSGRLVNIENVPDPVFAEKMVGDGVSIDPISQTLVAPCDGEVIQLHPSRHAVTVRSPEGVEVLIHIGLDTVMLRGEGFEAQVRVGDRVRAGDPLIEFDADYVATHARSLLTQIVITNGEVVGQFAPQTGDVIAGQDVALELRLAGAQPVGGQSVNTVQANGGSVARAVTSEAIAIPNPTGLHARPAAVLANLAKKYQSDIRIKLGDKQANVRSVVSVMSLQVERGSTVYLTATGEDANAAIAELTEAIRSGLGEAGSKPIAAPASVAVSEVAAPAPRPRSTDPNLILGVAASPGVAVGNVYRIAHQDISVAETAQNPSQERQQLEKAIAQARLEIEALRAKVQGQADAGKAAIFAAHQELLEDPELFDAAISAIDRGKSAAFAWKQAYTGQAEQLAQLKNELLAARANDLRDVGGRVLRVLTGTVAEAIEYPPNAILVAEDLSPSDTATMDRGRVLGFCTVGGGATSHVSILARAMDLPAIAGTEPRVLDLPNGTPVILDGSKGALRVNPDPTEMEQVRQRQVRLKARRERELSVTHQPAVTTDGQAMEIVANIGSLAEAQKAIELGTEGVGLLRSEFIFLDRADAPSEAEQAQIYTDIAKAMGDRPLIIRTLDVGGDKPLPYLPMPHEENPFLGERGIRIGLDRPEILRTQVRAILKASTFGNVKIMFPMIATLEEFRLAKAVVEEERQKLGVAPVGVGIMVEIPATAVMAEQFAKEVDFFSVGTNDLTQYTLAMDRGHPKLAPFCDGLNPAVLKLIGMAAAAANQQGKWTGVCGGIASDPHAVPLLIGLGVKELSVSVPTIPSVKAQVRELSLAQCRELAARAIACNTAAEVRSLYSPQED